MGGGPVSGEEIARVLRAVAGELERDPALARRVASAMEGTMPSPTAPSSTTPGQTARLAVPAEPVADDGEREDSGAPPVASAGRAFHPRLVTGLAPDLGPGVPNPFELRERLGEVGLRAALADLRLGTLRSIVREYQLDPKGKLKGLNDAEKLRKAILAATQR
jgi:hypothetical protein